MDIYLSYHTNLLGPAHHLLEILRIEYVRLGLNPYDLNILLHRRPPGVHISSTIG